MKAIILAGGTGSRLFPLTQVTSKQLLPVYDKPLIYYPLSTVMLAGCQDILIISTPDDLPLYKKLLGDGSQIGVRFSYQEQPRPEGLAQAFIIGEDFIGSDSVCLMLGDNLFYGHGLASQLQDAAKNEKGATIFGYYVSDPERYGVVEFDRAGKAINIQEKPENPRSHYAVPGLYFYDNQVVNIAKNLKPSPRGELEITDVNLHYLKAQELSVQRLSRGIAWLDTGTHQALMEAAHFISAVEQRQGLKIGCIEEVAYRMNFITHQQFSDLGEKLKASTYGEYILEIIKEER